MTDHIALPTFFPQRNAEFWAPAPMTARSVLVGAAAAALVAGFLITDGTAERHAVMAAGADLTRLLRAMAAIKALMAVGALAAIGWRLGMPARWPRLGGYVAAGAAMAAGPGLIWTMVHVGLGALLLHAGLAASVVLLWRDRAVAQGLARLVDTRRRRLAATV